MFLDKSCAELPHVIQHPFHPHHPLTLTYSARNLRCSACLSANYYQSFHYRCDLCEFNLHLRCASPILYPMIYMSELHEHPLGYSDNIPYGSRCSKCTRYNIHGGFRCLQCKFGIHDHCLPLLPPTVKTKWHRHPLTLTHAPIKNEGEEFNFYCDCCEEGRDLEDPSYYCAKCHLISHVRCVMWEVMDYLQGKSTKVGELCNTKVIVIGEAKAIDSIYAVAENKDRVEQGDHQGIMDEESDCILIVLRKEIAEASAELEERKAKLKGLEERLRKRLSDRLSDRLSQDIAQKIEFK